ncbi:unnamed protein product [Adineta steineri]|uniref:RING-type domain-containing protein n=1 Tax=Adineta steineri TaxID=433720 RepID=A0A819BI07_9BILA|nr:unnamed protein product [Adineta steineri]CAF3802448.1 unnamed protein product [Adineta steineri]
MTDATYEYMDETSIDPELICSICHSPLVDPQCTPCSETFCRECITNWLETQSTSCPHCRQTLSINNLTQAPRSLRNMLDRLRIKCTICGQDGLLRVNAEEHIEKVCPKRIVSCQSADIKCPWMGQRDQLNEHLLTCRYEAMRSIITGILMENLQLEDTAHKQITQINEQRDELRHLNSQMNQQQAQFFVLQTQNQTLLELTTQLKIQVKTYHRQNQQLNEELKQKEAQIALIKNKPRTKKLSSRSRTTSLPKLDCGGRACSKCGKCCDWYYNDYDINDYINDNGKRHGATCRNTNGRNHMCDCDRKKKE